MKKQKNLKEEIKNLKDEHKNSIKQINEQKFEIKNLNDKIIELMGEEVKEKKLENKEDEKKKVAKWAWVSAPIPLNSSIICGPTCWPGPIYGTYTKGQSRNWINLQSNIVFRPSTGSHIWQIKLTKYQTVNGWNVIGGIVTDNLSATPRCDDLAIIGYKNKLGACGIPGIGFITGYGCTIDGNAPGSSSVDKKKYL